MFVQEMGDGRRARRLICVGALFIGGCGSGFGLIDGDRPRSTLSLSALDIDGDSTYYESGANNFLQSAELVQASAEPRVIRGRIGGADDVDVFDLGPVFPGDRILVEMALDGSLDAAVALFDDTGASLLVNDHRNVYLGVKDPFVDVVIRSRMDACYVAVSATPGYSSNGDYALIASKSPSMSLPLARPDVALLVFNGGESIRIGGRDPVNVPVFDSSDIDPKYAGQTDGIIGAIVAGVRADYAGLDVTILSTSEGATYDGSMSRVFFGTFDSALLGVADGVDEFNATKAQHAIVFSDTFAAFLKLDPSATEIARTMANVASHEIGHLLGLIHTADRQGIMDVTASLSDMLQDQSFKRSPIYSAVFPIGLQDGVQSLLNTVGGDRLLSTLKHLGGRARAIDGGTAPSGPPAREGFYLSTCGLE